MSETVKLKKGEKYLLRPDLTPENYYSRTEFNTIDKDGTSIGSPHGRLYKKRGQIITIEAEPRVDRYNIEELSDGWVVTKGMLIPLDDDLFIL